MIRVVLDTNTVVSAQLKPTGLEATVLLLALRGDIALFISPQILAEYQRVLYKPKLKFDPRRVEAILMDIGAASRLVHPIRTLADAKHEPDNRFLECAEAAQAECLSHRQQETFSQGLEADKDCQRPRVHRPDSALGSAKPLTRQHHKPNTATAVFAHSKRARQCLAPTSAPAGPRRRRGNGL